MKAMIPQELNAGYSPKSTLVFSNSVDRIKFIADLGRNLLTEIHPAKVAGLIGSGIQREFGADRTAIAVELGGVGLVCRVYDKSGEIDHSRFRRDKFDQWLRLLPLQIAFTSQENFFFTAETQECEFVAPIRIDDQIRGTIVLGFDRDEGSTTRFADLQLVLDAIAQVAALSFNLSAHYDRKMSDSVQAARDEHRKFTESVLDALPVSLYVIDRHYRIVMWNEQREGGIQGEARDSVIGKNILDVLSKKPTQKLKEEFDRAFKTGRIERIEQQTTDEHGTTKHWVISKVPMRDQMGNVTHVITIGEDVTARVEAIHGVNRSEKLAAVGRLAAGVVHEINNPIATISACAEALETRVNEGRFGDSEDVDDLTEYLGLIRDESFRCKTITNGLLEFSRGRLGNRYPVEIGDLISSSIRLLKYQRRNSKIEFEVEIEPDLPLIDADEGQIQQAIIALSTNAIDAMPDGGAVKYRVTREKRQVAIDIMDSGIGIEPENLSKIFEPFFTTKEVGKGTGLGLAVSYGIVTDHNGSLRVRSKVGKGSTFSIYLPIANR